jgi:hypothetical protein
MPSFSDDHRICELYLVHSMLFHRSIRLKQATRRFALVKAKAIHNKYGKETARHIQYKSAPCPPLPLFAHSSLSITRRFCKWRSCETNAAVPGIEDGVETLKEGVAVDKVEALSGRIANVVDDKVYAIRRAADEGVERARPDLCVRGELERRAASSEEERLEVGVLRRRDAEQTSGGVEDGASCG